MHGIPGLLVLHVDGPALRDFTLHWEPGLPDFLTHGLATEHVRRLRISGFDGTANPGAPGAQALHLTDTTTLD